MNSPMKEKQTHRHKIQTCGCQGGGGRRRTDWECRVSRYKILCIEWTNNKIILYSTGSYIQYPVINHNGKGKKKGHYSYTSTTIIQN